MVGDVVRRPVAPLRRLTDHFDCSFDLNILNFFFILLSVGMSASYSRMRREGSRLTLEVWRSGGLEVWRLESCSLSVVLVFATVRNRPQPFAARPQ